MTNKEDIFNETLKDMADAITPEQSSAAMYMGNVIHKVGPKAKVFLARTIDPQWVDGEYRRYYYVGMTSGNLDDRLAKIHQDTGIPVRDCLYAMTGDEMAAARVVATVHRIMAENLDSDGSGWFYVHPDDYKAIKKIFEVAVSEFVGSATMWRYEARDLAPEGREAIKDMEALALTTYEAAKERLTAN